MSVWIRVRKGEKLGLGFGVYELYVGVDATETALSTSHDNNSSLMLKMPVHGEQLPFLNYL